MASLVFGLLADREVVDRRKSETVGDMETSTGGEFLAKVNP